mmetsp:Transcript_15194/g.7384  ORF Transcript_15194/g.7384 Transcript_15194/m.7384 type:complete len:86 (+) Transcript_15194:831-1088(+)
MQSRRPNLCHHRHPARHAEPPGSRLPAFHLDLLPGTHPTCGHGQTVAARNTTAAGAAAAARSKPQNYGIEAILHCHGPVFVASLE